MSPLEGLRSRNHRSSATSSPVLGLPLGSRILFSIILITFIHKLLKPASGAPISQGPGLSQQRLLCVGLPRVPLGFGSGSDSCIAKGPRSLEMKTKDAPAWWLLQPQLRVPGNAGWMRGGRPHPLSPSLIQFQLALLIVFPIFFLNFGF